MSTKEFHSGQSYDSSLSCKDSNSRLRQRGQMFLSGGHFYFFLINGIYST